MAERIKDGGGMADAKAALAELYRLDGQPDAALALAREAAFAAQQYHKPHSLYQCQWKLARLLKGRGGQDDAALVEYQNALATLRPIRHDVVIGSGPAAGDFRERIGPLF